MSPLQISSVHPRRAIPGGRITLVGEGFPVDGPSLPQVSVSGHDARVVFASPRRLSFLVPGGVVTSGPAAIRVDDAAHGRVVVDIAAPVATGLHQVDNPAIDQVGNVYLTYSG